MAGMKIFTKPIAVYFPQKEHKTLKFGSIMRNIKRHHNFAACGLEQPSHQEHAWST